MAYPKKCSDETIIEAYTRLKNIWSVGIEVGMCGQSVHERLKKIGVETYKKNFSIEEIQLLLSDYEKYAEAGKLHELSKLLKRSKSTICSKANELGLTNISRKRKNFETFEVRSERQKASIKKNGHPRGALGIKHSPETRAVLSAKSIAGNKRLKAEGRLPSKIKKQFETKMERYGTIAPPRHKASWKQGWRMIAGKNCYFRSSWEFNYALYLQSLVEKNEIVSWKFEPRVFWFTYIEDNLPSYRPDFEIVFGDGRIQYHEVKGWYDERSKNKLAKMKVEFPQTILVMIDKHWFKANKHLENVFPDWEKIKKYE